MPRGRKTTEQAGVRLHRRWRTALAFAGTTERDWAASRKPRPCSGSHVRQVVLALCTNDSLLDEVIAWIETQERRMVQEITAA